ncbi:MAG: class I poly(R)-hydroxyalkanoic acid synthase [Alphaproteobacteria bacterium]
MPDDTRPPKNQNSGGEPPQTLAANLMRVAARSLEIFAQTAPKSIENLEDRVSDNLTELSRTFGQVAEQIADDPDAMLEAQNRFWAEQAKLWVATARRLQGEEVVPIATPEAGDKRFADPQWRESVSFDFFKQSYLLASKWAEEVVGQTEGLTPHTRAKAKFYVRQAANALAPSNFPLTNPQVLRETLASRGENLVRGIENLARDLARGKGELAIKQTDMDAFSVGGNLATSPGKVIFQNDICQLIQYAPSTKTVHALPLLIVPPWINKFYVLDLTPAKSFIKWAVDAGHTVFVISWVNPDARHAQKSFQSYMDEGVIAACDAIKTQTGERQVNIIGYCVGGTLLATTLAFLAATGQQRVASATFLTTQVDFNEAGDLAVFVDEEQIANLEKKLARDGYLARKTMARAFNSLRVNELVWSYAINNYLMGRDPFAFDLLYWNADSSSMPAANHIFYLREFYLNNKLAKGEMTFGKTRLSLGAVKLPIYSVATRDDHIAPAASVFRGAALFGQPVIFVLAGSGHIAGVINPPKRRKYHYWAGGSGETLESWLETATRKPGSWWPHWKRWVSAYAGGRVPARNPANGPLPALEDAPGSYVKMRSKD